MCHIVHEALILVVVMIDSERNEICKNLDPLQIWASETGEPFSRTPSKTYWALASILAHMKVQSATDGGTPAPLALDASSRAAPASNLRLPSD